jgi:hypothetical protein
MAKSKSQVDERAFILDHPEKRPFGVRLSIRTESPSALGIEGTVWSGLSTGAIFSVGDESLAPTEAGPGHVVTLLSYRNPADAEKGAARLVHALLWMSASLDVPIALRYGANVPGAVFDRTATDGVKGPRQMSEDAPSTSALIEIAEAFATNAEPDPALTLSMELFASARFASSERARFLAAVSALEPLALAQSQGAAVDKFVSDCRAALAENPGIAAELKESLNGQLTWLRRESMERALRRISAGLAVPADANAILQEAYELKGQLIQTGRPSDPEVNLEAKRGALSGVIRSLYAARLGRKLLSPVIELPGRQTATELAD